MISALLGSALTLITIELLRESSPRCDCDDTSAATNSEGEKDTVVNDAEGNARDAETIRELKQRWSRRPSSRTSFSGSFSFSDVDGEKRHSFDHIIESSEPVDLENQEDYAGNGTNVVVLSEQGRISDSAVMQAQQFDDQVVSKLVTLEESKVLLHRTRSVSALASRFMAAPDEDACYDVATSLLVPLFRVDRCSYVLMKDEDHIIIKRVVVNNRRHATKLGLEGEKQGGVIKPIKSTMIELCRETLQQQYCPRTKDSKFENQRMMHGIGINSVLATPILVNGNNFAGAIVISMTKEDAFVEYDKALIQDIAAMLGGNIYAKRMRKAAENSNKLSREILHSMIPSKVIEKIEVFWDKNSEEYQSRRSSDNLDTLEINDKEQKSLGLKRGRSVSHFLNQMNGESNSSDAGIIVDTPAMEIGSTSRALYAENVKDVVIIFTDIVGFSKLALDMKPLEVVDMLQHLFCRFDALCGKHGVSKLETIGDAYICTTNLFDEDQYGGNVKNAALGALNMAKDMIYEAQQVYLPGKTLNKKQKSLFQSLEIRVGIHVGEVTCGVLGERLPKFTVFGHNVNLAARMEQTSRPSMIRATEAFHSLVADAEDENNWYEYEIISMKNMGDIGTYILDPSKDDESGNDLDSDDDLHF